MYGATQYLLHQPHLLLHKKSAAEPATAFGLTKETTSPTTRALPFGQARPASSDLLGKLAPNDKIPELLTIPEISDKESRSNPLPTFWVAWKVIVVISENFAAKVTPRT